MSKLHWATKLNEIIEGSSSPVSTTVDGLTFELEPVSSGSMIWIDPNDKISEDVTVLRTAEILSFCGALYGRKKEVKINEGCWVLRKNTITYAATEQQISEYHEWIQDDEDDYDFYDEAEDDEDDYDFYDEAEAERAYEEYVNRECNVCGTKGYGSLCPTCKKYEH